MADTNLPSTPADGNVKTVLVPAIKDLKAPTKQEATAVTAVDISCYLTRGGFPLAIEQATINDERECDTTVRTQPGVKTPSLKITGIDNTNTPYEQDHNELAEALTEGSEWCFIRRYGKPHTVELTSGDRVETGRFKVGLRTSVAPEANSTIRSEWNVFMSGAETEAKIAV